MTHFPLVEARATEVLDGLGRYVVATMPDPWSLVEPHLTHPPTAVLEAGDVEQSALDGVAERCPDADVVVGVGGGSSLDTAKYLAWKRGMKLVQVPTITSVDAGFTDAIGVRVDGHVRYVGMVFPEQVVLDLDLVRSAPVHLNRAGIGDILSCHTGLFDWRLAADAGRGVPWDEDYAGLGRTLLQELSDHVGAVRDVTPDAVRFLAAAYQRIGDACHDARHSRFEEGSEHFLAYAYEAATRQRHVHGELISMCVVAMSTYQGNDPEAAVDIVRRAGVRAHPADLDIERDDFVAALVGLPQYARGDDLDWSIVDVDPPGVEQAVELWDTVCSALPRVTG